MSHAQEKEVVERRYQIEKLWHHSLHGVLCHSAQVVLKSSGDFAMFFCFIMAEYSQERWFILFIVTILNIFQNFDGLQSCSRFESFGMSFSFLTCLLMYASPEGG